MQQDQNNTTQKKAKPIRPALIISKRILPEYSIFLKHLLVGLADDSILSALVSPELPNMNQMISPAVEFIKHPVLDLPLTGKYNKKALIEKLTAFRPTLLHCLCPSQMRITRQISRHLNIPYIVTINSLHKSLSQLSISSSRCAKIIVPTESIATNIKKKHSRFAERVEQINIGTFTRERIVSFSNQSNIASIVTALPNNMNVNFDNLLLALKNLAIDNYEFIMVILGADRNERLIRKQLTSLGISSMVIIVPKMLHWREVLSTGDIFLQPFVSTSFNPFLLEAMSLGSAVAGCKGGIDDLIIEGKTALAFDCQDELSIRRTLQKLLNSRDFSKKLATEARDYISKKHSVTNMVLSTVGQYRKAIEWYSK